MDFDGIKKTGYATFVKRLLSLIMGGLALALIGMLFWQLLVLQTIQDSLSVQSEPIKARSPIFHICALLYSPERDQFYERAYSSMKKAATSNGSALQLFEYSETESIEEIRKLLHLVRDIGPDGLIISLPSITPFEQEIGEISGKGIPIVTYETDPFHGKHTAHVGTNTFELGKLTGIAILDRFRQPQHIGILLSFGGGYNTTQNASFIQGLKHSIREKPEYEIALVRTVKDPQIGAETFLRDIIKMDPALDIIICTTARDTEAMAQALIDLDRVGKPAIVGFGDTPAIHALLEEGVVNATINRNPEIGGKLAVETIIALIQNTRTNAFQDPGATILYPESNSRMDK